MGWDEFDLGLIVRYVSQLVDTVNENFLET